METNKKLATVATIVTFVAVAASPTVASLSAGGGWHSALSKCPPDGCSANHNEVMATAALQ